MVYVDERGLSRVIVAVDLRRIIQWGRDVEACGRELVEPAVLVAEVADTVVGLFARIA